MIIEINKISAKPLTIEEDVSFSMDYKCVKPLLEIKRCKVLVNVHKYDEFIRVELHVSALCLVESSYSLKPFEYELNSEEEYRFSSLKSNDEECVFIHGNHIDLDPYIFNLICVSLPISLKEENEKLPSSGEGYNVYTEEEYNASKKEEFDPRFDKLNDIDFD